MAWDSWRLQRRWRRLQRPVALTLIAGGGLLLWARHNVPQPTVPTAVALADMPIGHVIGADEVEVVAWPADSRPAAAARSTDALVGRRTTSPVRVGEPLTDSRAVGPSTLADLGPGSVAVALPEEPLSSAGLIRPGDRVDIVGRSQIGSRTLVSAATVLTVADDAGPIVAVPATSAAQVVQAAATDSAAVVLRAD